MTQSRDLADGKFAGDVTVDSDGGFLFDKSDQALEFGDGYKATFGTGGDLQIFHDGSNSYISETGTGILYINSTPGGWIRIGSGNETSGYFKGNGAAELYYDNVKKLETTSTGVSLDNLAGLTTNGNVTITPNGTGIFVPKKVPSFYAYNSSAQSISDQTWTRVTLDSELFDTCSNFNTSNGRFTAPVNGIYSFTTVVNFGTDTASGGYVYVDILKTTAGGSATQYYTMGMRFASQVITNDTQINGSILLPLGQDDYVQLGAYQDVASGNVGLNGGRCYLTGHLVSGT